MKTTRLLLLPVLTLLACAAGARGQATSTAYSNLTTDGNINLPLGGASDGGSTALTADDLTYDAGSGGQNLSAFKVIIYNNNDNGSTESVTPTVVFWDSDGSAGAPGTLLGTYTLPLLTVAGKTEQTLAFTVPAASQFALPAAIGASPTHTIWAGLYVTGTSGESGTMIGDFGLQVFNPPTVGSSQDQKFRSNNPGSAEAVSNPSGTVAQSPFGGNPIANFGWELTTIAPGTLNVVYTFPVATNTFGGPEGALLLAADGNYYGTTNAEGAGEDGTIFQLTPDGTINTIFEFSGANGVGPKGALIQGNDGRLYGTTSGGGDNGTGTIFSIPTGSTIQALKVLHSFGAGDNTNADGISPSDALIQAPRRQLLWSRRGRGRSRGRDGLSHHPGWHFHPPGEFRDRRSGALSTLRRADRGRGRQPRWHHDERRREWRWRHLPAHAGREPDHARQPDGCESTPF